mmetsp:Transcript_19334/g.54556  ORF Transcript_19334/g.54556 Transcript_19334/m.54556 type:complete len:273 (-) Transcript_19334:126-944(-)
MAVARRPATRPPSSSHSILSGMKPQPPDSFDGCGSGMASKSEARFSKMLSTGAGLCRSSRREATFLGLGKEAKSATRSSSRCRGRSSDAAAYSSRKQCFFPPHTSTPSSTILRDTNSYRLPSWWKLGPGWFGCALGPRGKGVSSKSVRPLRNSLRKHVSFLPQDRWRTILSTRPPLTRPPASRREGGASMLTDSRSSARSSTSSSSVVSASDKPSASAGAKQDLSAEAALTSFAQAAWAVWGSGVTLVLFTRTTSPEPWIATCNVWSVIRLI